MIYGLYLSATGVLANSHRQDVIANNLANAETVGFKRDLALLQQRRTEADADPSRSAWTNDLLEPLGGGMHLSPSYVDAKQGEFEHTGNNLDVAVEGPGFLLVDDNGTPRLTRNGALMIDRSNHLVLADGTGHRVLGPDREPIVLDGRLAHDTLITRDGQISQANQPVARLGVFDVPDPARLRKYGMTLLNYPDLATSLTPSTSSVRSEFVERANVDPATELTQLMNTQRQLEANANMIRYQDQMLARLVNDVGKIS